MSVAEEVRACWERLETWARAHAPVMLDELRGPADPQAVSRLEGAMGVALPGDLRAHLLVHDGEEGATYAAVWFDGGELLGAERILEEWRRGMEYVEEPDREEISELRAEGLIRVDGPVKPVAFRPGWIPFMSLNGEVVWYVDLDPDQGGKPGQVIRVDLECASWAVVAPSFRACLDEYVTGLEQGSFDGFDEDGLPVRHLEAPGRAGDAPEADAELAAVERRNRIIEATTPLETVMTLPDDAECEVAGVVIETAGDRHELSVWGGSMIVRGDLGPRPEAHDLLKIRIRVGEPDELGTQVHAVVSWEPIA